jgi:hypothetical protein
MNTSAPKYVISGNTIEEISMSFAELVVMTQQLEVVKAKSTFAVWKLDDGTSESPIYKSASLEFEESKRLATQAGAPLSLAVDVRLLNLTPLHEVTAVSASKKAATIQRLTKRIDSVEDLKAKLARLSK